MSMKESNYLSVYVAMSRGEVDPCNPCQYFTASSIDQAVALIKEEQLDEIYNQLMEEFDGDVQEVEDNMESASEFAEFTNILSDELGCVEAGEEGIFLIVKEDSKWYEKLKTLDEVAWSEEDWNEFDTMVSDLSQIA